MKVKINQLKEGCILSKDVISHTNRPFMPRKTIISTQHIEALYAFLIDYVEVEPLQVTGEKFKPEEMIEEKEEKQEIKTHTKKVSYLDSVQLFKKLFKDWQAGASVDLVKVRNILIPLIEYFIERPKEIFMLHHYSNTEDYLFHHSITVGLLSALLGKKMNFKQGEWLQLGLAGSLIDCGMAKIDARIINKKGSLLPSEFQEIKQHPLYSYKLLANVQTLKKEAKLAILQHHERMDGSGYPMGTRSESLHLYSKIIAVADVYHAMTSERVYRTKQSPFKVLEVIMHDHFGEFDHQVIQTLVGSIANFSTGTKVKLSNNEYAEIVFIESKNPTRPMVKLIDSDEIIQLKDHRNLYIEDLV